MGRKAEGHLLYDVKLRLFGTMSEERERRRRAVQTTRAQRPSCSGLDYQVSEVSEDEPSYVKEVASAAQSTRVAHKRTQTRAKQCTHDVPSQPGFSTPPDPYEYSEEIIPSTSAAKKNQQEVRPVKKKLANKSIQASCSICHDEEVLSYLSAPVVVEGVEPIGKKSSLRTVDRSTSGSRSSSTSSKSVSFRVNRKFRPQNVAVGVTIALALVIFVGPLLYIVVKHKFSGKEAQLTTYEYATTVPSNVSAENDSEPDPSSPHIHDKTLLMG